MGKTTYELADIGNRFIALVIDNIIVGVIGGLLGAQAGIATGGIVGFIIGLSYSWFFWTRYAGQTPGKMLMNIQVVKADGTEITDADAVVRYIGYYINSVFMMLGWIWALFDSKNQGWHDKLSSTYVVKVVK